MSVHRVISAAAGGPFPSEPQPHLHPKSPAPSQARSSPSRGLAATGLKTVLPCTYTACARPRFSEMLIPSDCKGPSLASSALISYHLYNIPTQWPFWLCLNTSEDRKLTPSTGKLPPLRKALRGTKLHCVESKPAFLKRQPFNRILSISSTSRGQGSLCPPLTISAFSGTQ